MAAGDAVFTCYTFVIFPVTVCPNLDRAGHLSVTRHVQTSKVIVSAPINKVHWPLALMG